MEKWAKTIRSTKKHAWLIAIDQTKSLKRKGRPADFRALYNENLRKELNLAARRVQREERRAADSAERAAKEKQGLDTQVKAPKAKVIEEEKPVHNTGASSQPDQKISEVSGDSQQPQKGQPAKSTTPKTPPGDTKAAEAAPSLLTQDKADLPEKQEPTSSTKSGRKKSRKDKQESPKTVEELEREILEAHVDAWKTTETGQKAKPLFRGTRHVLQRVQETAEDDIPSSEKPSSEDLPKEESQPKSRSQKELEDLAERGNSVDKPEIYESEVDRMLASITEDDVNNEATSSGEAFQVQHKAVPETKSDSSSQPETKSNDEAASSSPKASVESKLEPKTEAKTWYTRYF